MRRRSLQGTIAIAGLRLHARSETSVAEKNSVAPALSTLPGDLIQLISPTVDLSYSLFVESAVSTARCLAGFSLALLTASVSINAAGVSLRSLGKGRVEFETQSEYSHIRVRSNGSVRTLGFVRANGSEAIESAVDIKNPQSLIIPYTQTMFAHYLFAPDPKRGALIGLGGGAMAHFLRHHDPEFQLDAVEIDPEVVKIAEEYFHLGESERIRIFADDGLLFLEQAAEKYDVIYMDAFLRPSAVTDSTGLPLRLKTVEFYRKLHEKLTPDGLVVFNLNQHKQVARDLADIKAAFAQTHIFRLARANLVVVASPKVLKITSRELRQNAVVLDKRFNANFSFRRMLSQSR